MAFSRKTVVIGIVVAFAIATSTALALKNAKSTTNHSKATINSNTSNQLPSLHSSIPVGPLGVSVSAYVAQFNGPARKVLKTSALTFSDLLPTPVVPGLLGSMINSQTGVYLVTKDADKNVNAIVVAIRSNGASFNIPSQLVAVACASLFPTNAGVAAAYTAFQHDALPKFGKLSSKDVISVGKFYDIRVVVARSGLAIICVEPGAQIPTAASSVLPT